MINQLKDQVYNIQDKFIENELESLRIDIDLIGNITAVQPDIVDALTQLFVKMHED